MTYGVFGKENIVSNIVESLPLGNTEGKAPSTCETFALAKNEEFIIAMQSAWLPSYIAYLAVRTADKIEIYGTTPTNSEKSRVAQYTSDKTMFFGFDGFVDSTGILRGLQPIAYDSVCLNNLKTTLGAEGVFGWTEKQVTASREKKAAEKLKPPIVTPTPPVVTPTDIDEVLKLKDYDAAETKKKLLMSILIPIFVGLLVLATSLTVICIMRRKNSLVGGVGQKTPAAGKPA